MKLTRKKKVFISYAREDVEHALRVNTFFEQHGVATWFDQVDSTPGARWRQATRTAVREADYFIALLSEISIEKKDGFVWREFELALRKQRGFPDNRKFIFPVQLDQVKIPEEFVSFHSVELSDEALTEILEVIETQELPPEPDVPTPPPYSPARRLITLLILMGFILALVLVAFNSFGAAPLIFKATIRDTARNPVQDAYAYILGPNNDTIIKSPPSGSNGQVYFELDTSGEIRATVWYFHPHYVKVSKTYTLMAHETPRYIDLVPLGNPDDPESPVSPVKSSPPEKLFLLTGLDLTTDEKQKIKRSTGYNFSYAEEAERISVDYDHEYDEALVEGKFTFLGSPVFIVCNSAKINTGIYFPPDGGVARTKEDIDRDNAAPFEQLVKANRSTIVNTLITCLKSL